MGCAWSGRSNSGPAAVSVRINRLRSQAIAHFLSPLFQSEESACVCLRKRERERPVERPPTTIGEPPSSPTFSVEPPSSRLNSVEPPLTSHDLLRHLFRMESEERVLISELKKKILLIFSDFMTRVTQFEELGAVGNRFLVGFHQGLEFLRQPPINKTSELINSLIRANETERVLKYVEAGCVNAHDSIQTISKLHTCQLGLQNHLSKAKCIVNELEVSVKEVTGVMQTANESKPYLMDNVTGEEFGPEATAYDEEEIESSDLQKPEITDYAAMMGIIYSMVKNDYIMQERIISSLGLKSSSGELESYTLMWSLRPFVNDEIMHQAWRLTQ